MEIKQETNGNLKTLERSYTNEWIFTLKKVRELKKVLYSDNIQQIHFWEDGTWICNDDSKELLDKEESLFTLMKDDFQHIDHACVKSLPFSICELIFGLEHCSLNVHEYVLERKKTDLKSFLNRNLYLNYYHSYQFDFNHNGIQFQCIIEWEKSLDFLRVKLDNETVGVAAGLPYMINYLFELSEEIYKDRKAFSLFCKEIRKFEEYYCKAMYYTISQTATPAEVLMFQREKTLDESGNFIKVVDLINYFELEIPFQIKEDGEIEIEFSILFDSHHDLYGYMDVNAIEWEIVNLLYNVEEKASEKEHISNCNSLKYYNLILQTEDFNISYRIRWDTNQEYYEVTNIRSQEEILKYNNISSLMYFFREIAEKITNYDTRIIYYAKIVSFGSLLYCEEPDYDPDYYGFNDILKEIESIEWFINSDYFGLLPF